MLLVCASNLGLRIQAPKCQNGGFEGRSSEPGRASLQDYVLVTDPGVATQWLAKVAKLRRCLGCQTYFRTTVDPKGEASTAGDFHQFGLVVFWEVRVCITSRSAFAKCYRFVNMDCRCLAT